MFFMTLADARPKFPLQPLRRGEDKPFGKLHTSELTCRSFLSITLRQFTQSLVNRLAFRLSGRFEPSRFVARQACLEQCCHTQFWSYHTTCVKHGRMPR